MYLLKGGDNMRFAALKINENSKDENEQFNREIDEQKEIIRSEEYEFLNKKLEKNK